MSRTDPDRRSKMEVIRRGAAAFETDWMFIIVTNDFSNVSALLFEVIKSEVFEAEVFLKEKVMLCF